MAGVQSFAPRSYFNSSPRSTFLCSTVRDTKEVAISSSNSKRSKNSPRLIKARQLLDQVVSVTSAREAFEDTTTAAAAAAAATSSGPINNSYQEDVNDGDDDDNVVVPDTYWSNGHLQEGDFVTRWARGQKVAEPLVKYDPIAAEKLLFRQPRKVRMSNKVLTQLEKTSPSNTCGSGWSATFRLPFRWVGGLLV